MPARCTDPIPRNAVSLLFPVNNVFMNYPTVRGVIKVQRRLHNVLSKACCE